MVSEAEAEASRIRTDTRGVWQQRGRLIEELRRFSDEALTVADDALERMEAPNEVKHESPASRRPPRPSRSNRPSRSPLTPRRSPGASNPGNGAEDPAQEPPKRRTVGPIGDPLDAPPQNPSDTETDEQPAVRRVGPERRQG